MHASVGDAATRWLPWLMRLPRATATHPGFAGTHAGGGELAVRRVIAIW